MTQKFVSVGSHAAPANVITRPRSDYDFIADFDTAQEMIKAKGTLISCVPNKDGSKLIAKYKHQVPSEAEIAWAGTSAERILNYCIDKKTYNAPMEVLLMMKLSHRYLRNSPHFLKTMADIWSFRKAGVKLQDLELIDILKQREEETYTYAHPKLNVRKNEFFSADGVNYIVDHDLIHEYVKIWDKPIYQKIAVAGEEVFSSKDKFFCELSDQERLSAVWEESAVLAIERSLLPFPGTLTPHQAFLKALEKVCTSITSGWFREYAWENYYKVSTLFPLSATTTKIEEAYKKCLLK
jgi:hypothetical protein